MYQGDIAVGSTLYFHFTTQFSGSPTSLLGTPVLKVFRDDNATPSTHVISAAQSNLVVDIASLTGLNSVKIDTSADPDFYQAGHNFSVIITTGTVGGLSAIGYKVASFSMQNRADPTGVTNIKADVEHTTYGLNALLTAIGTRMATFSYTAPDNADIAAIKAVIPATVIAAKADVLAGSLGAGSVAYTPNRVTDPSGNPLDGVDTWIGTNPTNPTIGIQARAYTIATGFIASPFMLDPGTYYVWRQSGGITFVNPEKVVIA